MIEFEVQHPTDRSMFTLNTNTIATFEPASTTTCTVTLTNDRQLTAAVPYSTIRKLVLEARSGFATTTVE